MSLRFDHAVVVVSDLASASAAFTHAGFRVTPGGRHDAVPTENALVAFSDGSYLELLAARDPAQRASWQARRGTPEWARGIADASAIGRRFLPHLAGGDGVADWVFARQHLARWAGGCRRRGVVLTGPVPMERMRADGERLAWQLVLPADEAFPFFIEDVTPRERRVPGGAEAISHPNRARGITGVHVRTPDVPSCALALADLLGATPRVGHDGASELEAAGLRVRLVSGSAPGACGVTLGGLAGVPEDLRALGIAAG